MKFSKKFVAAAYLASVAFVAGCGGGTFTFPMSVRTAPPSATATPTGVTPTTTPTPTTTGRPTASPTARATAPGATATPVSSPSPTPKSSSSASPTPKPTATSSGSARPTATPSGGATSPTPTPTPKPTFTPGPTPTPSPTPTMAPVGTVQVLPTTLYVNGLGAANAMMMKIDETAYVLNFTETDTCTPATGQIASVSPTSGTGPTLMATVTGIKAGTCIVTWKDILGDTGTSTVYVTTSSVGVNARGR